MKSKKGELTTNELLEIILVAAGIVLLAVFFYSLVSPMWDKGDETSKAYLESLMSQIETADDGGVGEFFIWPIESNEGDPVGYYLVYFGDKLSISFAEERSFVSGGDNKNYVCICSSSEEVEICNACKDLKFPVILSGESYIGKGEKIAITKMEDYYEFKRV